MLDLARAVHGVLRRDGTVHIRSARWCGDQLTVQLHLGNAGRSFRQLWEIEASGLLDSRLDGSPGRRLLLTRRHILIDAQIGPNAWMRFRGSSSQSHQLLADLWAVHDRVAGHWSTLSEFFSGVEHLPDLFRSGSGQAFGPKVLLVHYGRVLRKHGFRVALTDVTGKKGERYRIAGRWHRVRPPIHACIIGNAYMVARRFRARRVDCGD